MIIAVIAANGRTGRAFVEAALAAGHSVRAGVHQQSAFAQHPRLQVMPCDATNPHDVDLLLGGADAVVSLIGHVRHSPARVQTEATTVVTESMKRHGIRRIISLTGTGVRIVGDIIPLLDRIANFAIGVIDPERIADGRQHAEVLYSSGLDWTLLRVLKLTNGPLTTYGLQAHGPTRNHVSRRTVANAICALLDGEMFVQQAPIITE